MKKAKKPTSSSAEKKEWKRTLIPLVSGKENDDYFIRRAGEGADELVLLLVVDTAAMPGGFGFAASEIGHGNALMEEIKETAKKHVRECKDIVEWGDTESKITHLIQLKEIKRVFLIKQDNEFFKNLVKAIGKNTNAEVELVELEEMKDE